MITKGQKKKLPFCSQNKRRKWLPLNNYVSDQLIYTSLWVSHCSGTNCSPAGILSYKLTLYLNGSTEGSSPTHSPGPAQVRFLMNQMSRFEIHFSKYHPPIPSACSVPLLGFMALLLAWNRRKTETESFATVRQPVCWLPNQLLCLTLHFLIGHPCMKVDKVGPFFSFKHEEHRHLWNKKATVTFLQSSGGISSKTRLVRVPSQL